MFVKLKGKGDDQFHLIPISFHTALSGFLFISVYLKYLRFIETMRRNITLKPAFFTLCDNVGWLVKLSKEHSFHTCGKLKQSYNLFLIDYNNFLLKSMKRKCACHKNMQLKVFSGMKSMTNLFRKKMAEETINSF